MRRLLVALLLASAFASCLAQGGPAPTASTSGVTRTAPLREQLHIALARKALAAEKARNETYRSLVDSFRQQAADARASANDVRWVAGIFCLVSAAVVGLMLAQNMRRAQAERQKMRDELRSALEPLLREDLKQLLNEETLSLQLTIDDAKATLTALSAGIAQDRVSILDGLRLFFYRQAFDYKAQGAWGRAVLFTIHALVAEFEAAEMLHDESRFRYAQVAMANHGRLIVEHANDYARETEQAWWDKRDLEQIRTLKKFATPDLAPTLALLELYTIKSIDKLNSVPDEKAESPLTETSSS
ncbi:MAG TPA: hypothetical protein VG944_04505 [Fimbriimonas sp.]|nr:hypothetical protein [Fimbriimonas sp.]